MYSKYVCVKYETKFYVATSYYICIYTKSIGRTSYFNIPASPVANAKENALTVMKLICHVDDFVVIKIDIDHPEIESAMIDEILNDPNVSKLIDELYYEHHVSHSPMEHQGWGSVGNKIHNIYKFYNNFRIFKYNLRL